MNRNPHPLATGIALRVPCRRVLLWAAWALVLSSSLLRAGELTFSLSSNADSNNAVGVFETYELTLAHPSASYANPFQDVWLTATFQSPNAKTFAIRGFFYDTNAWKVRFVPDVDGEWNWSLTLSGNGNSGQASGTFRAVPSAAVGSLRRAPGNGYRWVRQNGKSFHPVGVQGVNRGGGYVCEDENVPSSTNTIGVLVDFDYYLDVMTGLTPQMARFEGWAAAGVPNSSSASWTYTPTNEAPIFTGQWRGQRWGSRAQQGVSGSHCLAIDLKSHNSSDHLLTTPPIAVQPGDQLFFAATSKMSVDAGVSAGPSNGFAYAVSVQISSDNLNWRTVSNYDQGTVAQYNWGYQTLAVQLQESGTRWLRWLLPAASAVWPTNAQYFFVALDNVRVAQRKPGSGEGINLTRHMAQFANDVIDTTSPLTYRLDQGKALDDYLDNLRRRQIAFIFCLNKKLGSAWSWHPLNAANGGPVTNSAEIFSNPQGRVIYKQCLDYIVARWAGQVDVWEHFNEAYATDNGLSAQWFQEMSAYLRAIDPYQHPICTTWDQPGEAWSDLSSPHWYSGVADTAFAANAASTCVAAYGKPILIDEFGNTQALGNHTDARFRTGIWAAFFAGGGLCFWDDQRVAFTNGPAPWGGNANSFVGAELRRYLANFNRFIARQPCAGLAACAGTVSDTANLETWGLASTDAKTWLFYLHNKVDHGVTNSGKTLAFTVAPGTYQAEWFSPRDGTNVFVTNYTGSAPTLAVPPFATDLALRFSAGPDTNPPAILAARASAQTNVTLEFNEPVSLYSLSRRANFSLNGGAEVLGATPAADGRSVQLLTSLLQPARTYQLTVTNLEDLQAPANRLALATLPLVYAGTNAAGLAAAAFRDASISINDASAAGKGNNGGLSTMTISYAGRDRALLWFPLPAEATNRPVRRATLQLYCNSLLTATQTVNVYRVTQNWAEGTSTWGGGWADGVTWRASSVDTVSAGVYTEHMWAAPGGDFDPAPIATAVVSNALAFVTFDITSAVNGWANGLYPNCGLLLMSPATPAYASANFSTRNDYAETWKGPRVALAYGVAPQVPPLVFGGRAEKLPDGIFQASFANVPGWSYSVGAANDLRGPWVPLTNGAVGPQGTFLLQDRDAGAAPRRFYKVTQP